jgi:hypothetical protein
VSRVFSGRAENYIDILGNLSNEQSLASRRPMTMRVKFDIQAKCTYRPKFLWRHEAKLPLRNELLPIDAQRVGNSIHEFRSLPGEWTKRMSALVD